MLNPGWAIYLLCDLKKSLKFSKLLQCEASKSLLPEGYETTTHDGRQCLTRGACSKMGILLPKALQIVISLYALLLCKNNKIIPTLCKIVSAISATAEQNTSILWNCVHKKSS